MVSRQSYLVYVLGYLEDFVTFVLQFYDFFLQPSISVGNPFPQQTVAVGNSTAPSFSSAADDEIEDDVNWDLFV